MEKIPTVFVRDEMDRRYVTDVVDPRCAWVLSGEGDARRKWDGTCVMVDDNGRWWARREVKPGKHAPDHFVPVHFDNATGKTVGWEPMEQSAFARWHAEAIDAIESIGEDERHIPWSAGTFELVGPKINGNPEKLAAHMLVRHLHAERYEFTNRSFTELREALLFLRDEYGHEGVVFHHPDGRMAKLKARDFRRDSEY